MQLNTALIYLRISVNRTSEHASIQQQRDDCVTLADRLGYTCTIEFIDEAVSAYQDRTRPAYQQLLRQIERSRTATVIVWHLDRLYRRPRELEQLLDLLDTRPVRVETVQGGSFDLNRHEGRLFARQLVAFANYESAHKGARVARAQQQRAARGLLHGGSHYGYCDDGSLDQHENGVIHRIVDDFLTGMSVTAIARELTYACVTAPAGGTRWGTATVMSILSSDRLHHRRGQHKGSWERMISADDSALIRALQIAPARDGTRSSVTLLGGMARCGACGSRLVSAVNHRGQHTYRCRAQLTSCSPPGSCTTGR
ncbi:recombinase family protein [Microbacterium lacticum]